MKENITEKCLVPKFNITPITSKNDLSYIKEPRTLIDIYEQNNNCNKKNNFIFLTKKKQLFKIGKISNKPKLKNLNFNDGRWKKEENNQFLLGISLYGNLWKKVNQFVKTRTAVQVRSHAQKFLKKMKLCKDDNLGIDFTLDSINNINDMIKQIKTINPNYNVVNIFKKLYYLSKIKNKFNLSK